MITWGLTYVVHSTLLIAAVWIACRFLRSASARETLWKIALLAPLLTATLELTVPLRKVTPVHITLPSASGAAGSQPAEVDIRRTESAPLHKSVDPRAIAIDVWIAGAALLLLRLLGGRLLFLRALRDRVELLREHDRLARLRAAMSCTQWRSIRRAAGSAALPHRCSTMLVYSRAACGSPARNSVPTSASCVCATATLACWA